MKSLVGKGKPFHSALDKAAGLLKRKVGTGAEFMNELRNMTGIKQAEIDERKLGEIMGMPKMTHEQFLSALQSRPAPAVREKVLGGDPDDPNWIGPYQIADMLCFCVKDVKDEYGITDKPHWVHEFGTWLAEDKHGNDSWLTKLCEWVQARRKRTEWVHIDYYDIWSIDRKSTRLNSSHT